MSSKSRVYLSLGSNMGRRLEVLQTAIECLYQRAGSIIKVSSVYESEAWNFVAPPFLNLCVSIETTLKPIKLLQTVLQIEKELGRERNTEKGYASRIIDIDVLYYDQLVLNNKELVIPHPSIQLRRFVLLPLNEIAQAFKHPVLNKNTNTLLKESSDELHVHKISDRIKLPKKSIFSKINYLVIEGNIGSGKTSLATKIAADFNAKLVLERFADNPFLPRFYKDPKRYAFPLEMSFLADRYQQFKEDTLKGHLFTDFMVSDYDIYKSLIFAGITLPNIEFELYRKLFFFMYGQVVKPDLYVYLYQTPERLLENIKKRGRNYEQEINAEYLQKIHNGYMDFIRTAKDLPGLIIDMRNRDFVKNPDDYEHLIDKMRYYLDDKNG